MRLQIMLWSLSLVIETILVDSAAVIGTKLQLSPVCLECWKPTDQVIKKNRLNMEPALGKLMERRFPRLPKLLLPLKKLPQKPEHF